MSLWLLTAIVLEKGTLGFGRSGVEGAREISSSCQSACTAFLKASLQIYGILSSLSQPPPITA